LKEGGIKVKKQWVLIFVIIIIIAVLLTWGFLDQSKKKNKKVLIVTENINENIKVKNHLIDHANLYAIEVGSESFGYNFIFEFSLNCIKLPEILKQANANFTFGYQIFLDRTFHPRSVYLMTFDEGIANVTKGILDSDEVISCIKKWKFVGLDPRSVYTVLLRWEHMKGWVTMMIYSDKMNLLIKLVPD